MVDTFGMPGVRIVTLITGLAGTGTRMVTADANGLLSANQTSIIVQGRAASSTESFFSVLYDESNNGYLSLTKRGSNTSGNYGSSNGASEVICTNGDLVIGASTENKKIIIGTDGLASSSKRMEISLSGVLINNLAGTGNRMVYSGANGLLTNTSSDARVKKNVENITQSVNVLETLKKLRGVKYNWDTNIEGYENMGEQQEIGVIAQEIEQYIPEIVGENNTGYKSVDYAKLTAYLIEVNKALLEKIEALEEKVM